MRLPYSIDLHSTKRAFPPGIEAPQLLLDFVAWLKGRPWGSVGCFDLVGQFPDTAPIVDGGPLRKDLALFIYLPDGSAVGMWFQSDMSPENAPIVVLGSEGQHEILAASFEGLLAKIALQQFEEDGEWTDFLPHEDTEDATDEFAVWLAERLGVVDLRSLTKKPADLPDFAGWMGQWCSEREDYWATHPMMRELAELLKTHKPGGRRPWIPGTTFEVAIVGELYQVRVLRRGRQPVEEAAVIEPVLRKLRDDMLRAQPDLGLWWSMSFRLYGDGRILPSFDYETRPTFDDVVADLSQARIDLFRAPRPARWVPPWLSTPQQ